MTARTHARTHARAVSHDLRHRLAFFCVVSMVYAPAQTRRRQRMVSWRVRKVCQSHGSASELQSETVVDGDFVEKDVRGKNRARGGFFLLFRALRFVARRTSFVGLA